MILESIQKLKVLRGIATGRVAYTDPYHIGVDITRRCNLHCLGCRYHTLR